MENLGIFVDYLLKKREESGFDSVSICASPVCFKLCLRSSFWYFLPGKIKVSESG